MPQEIITIEIAPAQKVVVSGTIEVEAQSYRQEFNDPNNPNKSTKNDSDVTLATLEIGIDAEINPSVQRGMFYCFGKRKRVPFSFD